MDIQYTYSQTDVWQAYMYESVPSDRLWILSQWNFQISFYYHKIGNFVCSRDKSQFIWYVEMKKKITLIPSMKHNTISNSILFKFQRNIPNNYPDACIIWQHTHSYKYTLLFIFYLQSKKKKLKWKERGKKQLKNNNNKHSFILTQAING